MQLNLHLRHRARGTHLCAVVAHKHRDCKWQCNSACNGNCVCKSAARAGLGCCQRTKERKVGNALTKQSALPSLLQRRFGQKYRKAGPVLSAMNGRSTHPMVATLKATRLPTRLMTNATIAGPKPLPRSSVTVCRHYVKSIILLKFVLPRSSVTVSRHYVKNIILLIFILVSCNVRMCSLLMYLSCRGRMCRGSRQQGRQRRRAQSER